MFSSLRFATSFLAASLAIAASAAEVETLTIKALSSQMRYDLGEMIVSPGAQVKLTFENTDDMPHNIVFFEPGTDVVAVCAKQMEKAAEALKRNWLPEDPRMWLHSKLLNPKEKEEILFKAPEKPGAYPYVCSFPGHATTMNGLLKVMAPGPKLTSLHFSMYLGDWKELPDFTKLKPHREGEMDGVLEIQLDDYKNQFGVVYTGKLKAPADGEYTFAIAGDDGVRLLIDGTKVVEFDGIHPAREIREGKIKLAAGEHDFRLEYFQAAGEAELYVAWRGADFALTPLSKWVHPNAKAGATKRKDDKTKGMPLIVGDEPLIYRNFITGAGNRAIAVGYPGGLNLAWSAEQMNAVYLWRGGFMDAARHWRDRGGGAQPPLGVDVVRLNIDASPAFAVLPALDSLWPILPKGERLQGFQWKGYRLDAKRIPTFSYEWNGVRVTDRFEANGPALNENGAFIRTLHLGGLIPVGTMFRVASGSKVEAIPGGFLVDGGPLNLGGTNFDNRFRVFVDGGIIVNGKALVIPARPQMQVTYRWATTRDENANPPAPAAAPGHVHAH